MSVVMSDKSRGKHWADSKQQFMKKKNVHMNHIDGLRGMAILLVVIFHVFVGKVSSGVDVFLFIGGIVLLTSQMKNASNPNGLHFTQSIIRILRRLLPSLITVITITVITATFIYTRAEWQPIFKDASASLTYWMNWNLALNGNTYASANSEVSLFQHLWSMSVQLQIYIIIIATVFITRFIINHNYKHNELWRKILITIISIATFVSFVYAAYSNFSGDQTVNYYSTFSRFWEIGVGAIFGLIISRINITNTIKVIFSIIGVIMIFSVGIFLNGAEQFPGVYALIPIVGAMMVITAGLETTGESNRKKPLIIRILESKIFIWFGKISYSLYLWHWSILILLVHKTGEEAHNIKIGIPVIAISLILAYLTNKFVEEPLRQKQKPLRMSLFNPKYSLNIIKNRKIIPLIAYTSTTMIIIIAFTSVVLSPNIFNDYNKKELFKQEQLLKDSTSNVKADVDTELAYPGAAAFTQNVKAKDNMSLYPDPSNIDAMMPQTQADGCYTDFGDTELHLTKKNGEPCAYGDTDSEKTLYLVGGSHSEQYLAALDNIGKNRNIKIVPILKMGCALYHQFDQEGEDFPECYRDWSPKAEQYILDNPPTEGVFMVTTRPMTIEGYGVEMIHDYYIQAFQKISDAGIKIYGIRDNAWLTDENNVPQDPKICLLEKESEEQCGQPASKSLLPVNPAISAYQGMNIKHIDINNTMIKDGWIHPVVGNILVFRDMNHMTQQFVKTLTPELEKQMFDEEDTTNNIGITPKNNTTDQPNKTETTTISATIQ